VNLLHVNGNGRAITPEEAAAGRITGSNHRPELNAAVAASKSTQQVYAIMQSPKQLGRINVTAGTNRANRPGFDSGRTRQHVDRLENHDF
jgi:hypothetical protein